MTWLRLALALVQVISKFMTWYEQAHWMNEGERRLRAQIVQEIATQLAQAAGVVKELEALNDEDLQLRIEEEGWYRHS
jgi:hypothetical protein